MASKSGDYAKLFREYKDQWEQQRPRGKGHPRWVHRACGYVITHSNSSSDPSGVRAHKRLVDRHAAECTAAPCAAQPAA